MHDPNWALLSDAERGQLVAMWMLAADRNGTIPADPKIIKTLCYMQREPIIQVFVDKGFIEPDATVTPERRQADANVTPQTRLDQTRLDQTRLEERRLDGAAAPVCESPLTILKTILDDDTAKAVIDYRTKRKQSNSILAMRRLANQLSQTPNPNDGAAEMICRNWSGFRPAWMQDRGTGPPAKEKHFRSVVNEFINEVDAKHGNGRRAIRSPSGVGNVVELHAAAPGLENHVGVTDTSFGGASKINATEDG
jgi:hypothetical protein